MKYLAFLLFIVSLPSFAMDGFYQLPTEKTIENRLKNAKLENFACNSKIAEAIGNRFFKPIYLHEYVKFNVERYNSRTYEWKYRDFPVHQERPTVSVVMTLLLQDYPKALVALKNNYDGAFLQ